jgi:hypothetical protein
MLFLEEHIRAVLPALAARRDGCDAMLCMMSAGEVMRLTRVGRFEMAGEAGGALRMLKRLRGGRKGGQSSGQGQMRMLRSCRGCCASSRQGAGRAGVLPRAAILAGGVGGEPRQPRPDAGVALRRGPALRA